MTVDEANELLSAVRQAHFMTLTFYDPKEGAETEGVFYISNILAPVYKYNGNTPKAYKGVKIVFEER